MRPLPLTSGAWSVALVLVTLLVVAGLPPPAAAQQDTTITAGAIYTSTSFTGNTNFIISRNIPSDRTPVQVTLNVPILTNAVLSLVGWSNNAPEGEFAFSYVMSGAQMTDSSFKMQAGPPTDSIVQVRNANAQSSGANPLPIFDFQELIYTRNLTVVLTNLFLEYDAGNTLVDFIPVGSPTTSFTIQLLSSLQVLATESRYGRCLVSMAAGSAQDVSTLTEQGFVSISDSEPCYLSRGVFCSDRTLIVTRGSTFRLWNISTTGCTDLTATPTRALYSMENGVTTVTEDSLFMVQNIDMPGSYTVDLGANILGTGSTVDTNSVITFQNLTNMEFCQGCTNDGGFIEVFPEGKAYVGPWTLNGVPVTDYGSYLGGDNGANIIVVDPWGKNSAGSCQPSTCQPGRFTDSGATDAGCTCNCVDGVTGVICVGREIDSSPCGVENCVTCAINSNQCSDCRTGYLLRESENRCAKIYCTAPHCRQCVINNAAQCDICVEGYYNNNGVCTPCSIPFCVRCDPATPNFCPECARGFTWNGTACMSNLDSCMVAHCLRCLPNNAQCEVCESGYGLTSNLFCARCAATNCIDCAADFTICNTCAAGYYLTQVATCSRYPCNAPDCLECSPTNPNVCTVCNPPTVLGGGQCLPEGTCNAPNCRECRTGSAELCNQCNPGYARDENFNCVVARPDCNVANCDECESGNPGRCRTCSSGYFITATYQCTSSTRCRVYYCAQCQKGQPTRCQNCNSGYGITTLFTCVKLRSPGTIIVVQGVGAMPTTLLAALVTVMATAFLAFL